MARSARWPRLGSTFAVWTNLRSTQAAFQTLGTEDVPKWVYDTYVKTTAELAKLAIDSKGSVGALHAAFKDRATT